MTELQLAISMQHLSALYIWQRGHMWPDMTRWQLESWSLSTEDLLRSGYATDSLRTGQLTRSEHRCRRL